MLGISYPAARVHLFVSSEQDAKRGDPGIVPAAPTGSILDGIMPKVPPSMAAAVWSNYENH